jgi:hypothetical protein
MLAKNHEERPTAAEISAALGKLRAARQQPPYLRVADMGNGVPLPVFEQTTTSPSTHLVVRSPWSDPED